MTPIGATFAAELVAAGVPTNGISWGSDGTLSFDPAISPATIALVQQVKAAHDPTKQLPAVLLAQLVAQKIAAAYNDTTLGHVFSIDQVSQDHIADEGASAAASMIAGSGVAWPPGYSYVAADGTQVAMTAAQTLAWSQRVRAYVGGLIRNQLALGAAIAAGGNPDITQGWPANT